MVRVIQLMIFLGFLAAICTWRWLYIAELPATWDQVDFVLALDRFDLLAMQPHFPGYPYYIVGGMLVHRWISDPGSALIAFQFIILISSIFPIYVMARAYTTYARSLLIAAGIHSAAYIWILSAQPMAETSAIALLCWYWWSLLKASKTSSYIYQLIPLLLFSLIMGIRLSYVVFGIGIVLLWVHDYLRCRKSGYRMSRQLFRLSGWIAWTLFFQSIWIIGLIMSAGHLSGFIQMAMAFTDGHFSDWGGTASISWIDLVQRLYLLIVHNLIWTGLATQNLLLAAVWVGILIFIIYNIRKLHWSQWDLFSRWFAAMGLAYLMFAWLAQNIDKPRHIAPLIFMIIGALCLLLLRRLNEQSWKGHAALGLIILLIASQTVIGALIMKQHSEQLPAIYEIAQYLEKLQAESEQPIMVYTWEETRVFEYMQVSFEHKRIYTFEFFHEEVKLLSPRRIFITGQALDGFIAQHAHNQSHLIESFHSDSRFDPIYANIRLYEWIP